MCNEEEKGFPYVSNSYDCVAFSEGEGEDHYDGGGGVLRVSFL